MRAFVVLSIFAVASAGRLGYNYQPGGDGGLISSGSGISSVGLAGSGSGSRGSGISIISAGSGLGGGSEIGGGSGIVGGSGIGGGFGNIGGSAIGGSLGVGGGSIGSSGSIRSSGLGGNQIIDAGLNKEFYVYSAPEEEIYDGEASQRVVSSLRKNLRVVFIKAPENNGVKNAALQLARQANEDRTAIYVLSKEPDVSELANQVQELRESIRQKPEVRFIKYRTNEDAINAQRSIQQQYDNLGGSSQSSDEGIAPVLNFASASEPIGHAIGSGVDFGNSGSASNVRQSDVIASGGRREYLPPVVF